MLTIAIDGPVGAGKSTIARELAKALGILHLDTGAMYRALALKALRLGTDIADAEAVEALLGSTNVAVELGENGQRTLLDDEDVTDLIRTPEVSALTSAISTNAAVRSHMVALQRDCAAETGMVVDGRDIGTRVLPDAPHKFYLNASVEVRARRRHKENRQNGIDLPYETVLQDAIERDERDMTRVVDPLRVADGAHEVDTTALDIDGVVAYMLDIIKEKHAI